MKDKVAGFEHAHGKCRTGEKPRDPFRGVLVFREEKHGRARKRTAVLHDLDGKGIARAALQTIYHQGQGLFCAELLTERDQDAFIFTVAPYELCNSHRSVREATHGRLDFAAHAENGCIVNGGQNVEKRLIFRLGHFAEHPACKIGIG